MGVMGCTLWIYLMLVAEESAETARTRFCWSLCCGLSNWRLQEEQKAYGVRFVEISQCGMRGGGGIINS